MKMQWWKLPKQPIWDKEGNVLPTASIVAVWVKHVKGGQARQYGLWSNGVVITRLVPRTGPHRWEGEWKRKKQFKFKPELIDQLTRHFAKRGFTVAYRTEAML